MPKLVSEQLPNDGGYHVPTLVREANDRLKEKGKHGKTAKIVAKKSSLTLQFTLHDGDGNPQKNKGLGGISASAKGVREAEGIAEKVTYQLVSGTFTWDWFYKEIGKDTSEKVKQLTCKEMVEQFKKHFFKQRKDIKSPEGAWYSRCNYIERELNSIDKPISLPIVRKIIESTDNNTSIRTITLSGLVEFLKYFNNTDYKDVIREYKANNKPKPKNRNIPSDEKIVEVYENGFTPPSKGRKDYLHRYPQWHFFYGLLATYGLRIHEAWSIANWDEPVTLKDGDWVTVDVGNDEEIEVQRTNGDLVVPAILDPNNTDHILCIKHNTKTGYRMAFPISPGGHNWIEEFNLLQPLNLPDLKNPLRKTGKNKTNYYCSSISCQWFQRHDYGFTPHDLRHAYVQRGHQLGYNPKALADSAGHSIKMSSTTYLKHMSLPVKLKGMKYAMTKEQNKRSELEILREENEALKAQLEAKDEKIKRLEAELFGYTAIKESLNNKQLANHQF